MKRKVSTILLAVTILESFAHVAVGRTPDSTSQRLFLAVVIDSSPTSAETWQQLKLSACQAIDHLRQDDRVEILRAREGEPALHSDSLIQSPSVSGRQNLHLCVRDIKQIFFLSKADVAKAVAAAFEHLGKHSTEYSCSVLVFSAGNLNADQVRQVRRLAAACKFRNWSLAFLVPEGANRGLFVAASQGEFDVMFLEKGNLAQWLEKARDQGPAGVEKAQESPRLSPPDKMQRMESEPPLTPIQPRISPQHVPAVPKPGPLPVPKEPEHSSRAAEPNQSVTRYILPVYPVPQDTLPFPTLPQPKPPLPDDAQSKAKRQPWLWSLVKNRHAPAVAVGCSIVGLIVLVMIAAKSVRHGDDLSDLDEYAGAGAPQKLMCSVDNQQYDLGEEDSINMLVIGKGPTSAVPLIDDDELEDEHIKIFRRRHGYKIRDLAEQPIMVGGTPVKKGQKLDLLLPATIELTKKSRITLFREPVLPSEHEMQTSGESHEFQDVRSAIE